MIRPAIRQQGKAAKAAEFEQQLLDAFFLYAREWRWHSAFCALDNSSMLVTDAKVQAALEQAYGKLSCRVMTPANFKQEGPGDVENIIFLCQHGEWHLTKRGRHDYPGKTIVSAIYDLAPLGILPDRKFPLDSMPRQEPLPNFPAPARLCIAQAGSDYEYLLLAAAKNGFPASRKLGGRALESWMQFCSRFFVMRFVAATMANMPTEEATASLDMAMLQTVFGQAALTPLRFLRWLNDSGTLTLYFVSRDKVRQVAVQQLMADKDFGSLWDRAESAAIALEGQIFDLVAAHDKMIDSLRLELQLEVSLERIDRFKYVTLEELVEQPGPVLTAIGLFWDTKPPRKPAVLNWCARYNVIPDFKSQIGAFRKDTLLKFGLSGEVG